MTCPKTKYLTRSVLYFEYLWHAGTDHFSFDVIELEKMTFYYVGVIIALSLIHGSRTPHFISSAVVDYIIYGIQKVKATIEDVPHYKMKQSLQKGNLSPL